MTLPHCMRRCDLSPLPQGSLGGALPSEQGIEQSPAFAPAPCGFQDRTCPAACGHRWDEPTALAALLSQAGPGPPRASNLASPLPSPWLLSPAWPGPAATGVGASLWLGGEGLVITGTGR